MKLTSFRASQELQESCEYSDQALGGEQDDSQEDPCEGKAPSLNDEQKRERIR